MLDSVLIGSPVTDFSADEGGSGGSPIFPNIVGGGILRRFIVTLDYAHYTMFLKQTAEPKTDLDSYDRSGMWMNQEDSLFLVVSTVKDGPADRGGLEKGDRIIALNGIPVSQLRLYEVRERLRDQPPER
jgi:C-terminal processing protease CtpA/Prc